MEKLQFKIESVSEKDKRNDLLIMYDNTKILMLHANKNLYV